jgi:hypothetical protein
MNPYVSTIHTHFNWCDWDNSNACYVNPLDYLTPSATGTNYTWTFNPSGYTPAFEYFFLEDCLPSSWPNDPADVQAITLDPNNLSGDVDAFFGFGLSGVGQTTTPECGRNDLTAERIEWNIKRSTVSGLQLLVNKYLVNFNCPLNNEENEKVWQLYFKWDMDDLRSMFTYIPSGLDHEGLVVCLSNCGNAQGRENLGIDNIEENCWQTNSNHLFSGETVNPVLAAFPDGPYKLGVRCYAHDENVTFPGTSEYLCCELHNFHPALQEVSIIALETDTPYYHGLWEPNGLSAELDVSVNNPAPAGAELQVILLFTESMDTSSLSAVLGPLSVGNGQWSSSVVENDTWTGEITLPAEEMDGSYILCVDADDMDGNHLMDPEGAGSVPGPTRDTHHSLSVGFETGLEWTVPVHGSVLGSPKLADIDLDGDLDIIIQSADGWVDVLDDDGSSMPGWPVSGGWSTSDPSVMASPSIANLTTSSTAEILAVHPYGCNAFESSGLAASPWSYNWGGGLVYYPAWSSPVTSDIDNNGDFELILGRQNITQGSNPISLYVRDTDGSLIKYKTWDLEESVTATPSVCDVDGNGSVEVIAVTDVMEFYPGLDGYGTVYCFDPLTGDELWNRYVGGMFITGAISTGEILTGGAIGVVVGAKSGSNSIKVLSGLTGNPAYPSLVTNGAISAGTSIADVNGDGHPDIVASSENGYLYCWRGDTGENNPGFPVNLGAFTDDGISIGDIDGDGILELVIAGTDGKLHVINHDGTSVSGFPVRVSSVNSLSGQPAIGDIDNDGRLEIVFGEENNSVLHCYELGNNTEYNYLPWPQFQHDAQNTGYFPTDITPPAVPENFSGFGETSGSVYLSHLSWTLSVNDPDPGNPDPTPPTDVVSYRIYRKIPPRPLELVGTVPAGTDAFTDVLSLSGFFPVVAYTVTAWDGVNESAYIDWVKLLPFGMDILSVGCPVREIIHSTAVQSVNTQAGVAQSYCGILQVERNNCSVLTDGRYDTVYTPSGGSDCVEIDLGAVCTVSDVSVTGIGELLNSSVRHELSVNGREFTDTGRARYVRVYGAAGSTEIEVIGERVEQSSSPIEVQRDVSGGFRIATAESGSPLFVTVFDLAGRSVWRGSSSTGEVLWNRCTSSGNTVPDGVYLVMVQSDDINTYTSKVVVR